MRNPTFWKILAFVVGICLFVPGALLFLYATFPPNAVPEGDGMGWGGYALDLDDPSIEWSAGWRVTGPREAIPPEPANPAAMPSGTLRFDYQGELLGLRLDQGDYWGYLYVTVDGAPANLLPTSDGHVPPPPIESGYLPLYRPEAADDDYQEFIPVHRSSDPTETHSVEITVWRAWDESPLRAIATVNDPFDPLPAWWLLLAFVVGLWLMAPLIWMGTKWLARLPRRSARLVAQASKDISDSQSRALSYVALGAFVVAGVGVWLDQWFLTATGLIVLALVSTLRPAFWYAAFLFALPFYFTWDLPLPGGRHIGMVDVGALLGLAIACFHALLHVTAQTEFPQGADTRRANWVLLLLAAIASWALISASDAEYPFIALREWRTVFLAALLVAAGLTLTLRFATQPRREVAILVGGWLLGATLFAALALWLYPDPNVIIPAEGVQRLRGFYGSPNNLALYLERTLAVTLALLLFLRDWRWRIAAGVAALLQLAAFLLTFSKGGLFLALPVMGIVLWVAGFYALRRQGRSTRILWALAGVAAVVVLATLPFLGTERFARIIDLGSGTGFVRVNLWRAAWQMALDHPWLGVGPDGFLYAYRSQYIFPQAWMEPNLNHPHNWLLDWWTRLGIPGLLLGLAFWGTIVWNCVQNLRRGWGWSALTIGILAATAAALAHGLIDLSYALPDLMIVWALFAVLTSIRIRPRTT